MNPWHLLLAQADGLARPGPDARLWARLAWLDRLDALGHPAGDDALAARLDQCRAALEAQLEALFTALRAGLRAGRAGRLQALVAGYRVTTGPMPDEAEGFDALDELVAGVLQLQAPAAPRTALAPEMVAYQPTPARHVLDLLARVDLRADDTLVDIGAGLGQVPMLAGLCSPARALGIEIEPGLVDAARQAADGLGLAGRVRFTCQDVREADLSSGTVFYLYTPLRGGLLADLLERLREQAARRPLRVGAFGPCVEVLAAQPWLRPQGGARAHRVAVFHAG